MASERGPSPERIAALYERIRDALFEFSQDSIKRGRGNEGVYGRREEALAALDELVAALEAAEEKEGMVWHADDCQIHNANPPWRCTCDAITLRAALEAERQRADRWMGLADRRGKDGAMAGIERSNERLLRKRAEAERDDARRQLARAQAVLRWYADFDNWTQLASWGSRIHDDDSAAIHDSGRRARIALAELPETPPEILRPNELTATNMPETATIVADAAPSREPGKRQ